MKIKPIDEALPKVKIIRNRSTQAARDFWDSILERKEQRIRDEKALEIFKELGIDSFTPSDILELLRDEVKLKEVLSKLKLKAFW